MAEEGHLRLYASLDSLRSIIPSVGDAAPLARLDF